jgi:hypothetical protein
VGPIIALVLIAQSPGIAPANLCTTARRHYEDLAFEPALQAAEAGLRTDLGAPICLEVRALILLATGREQAAAKVLATLFEMFPDYVVDDRALDPTTRKSIEEVRGQARPLVTSVSTQWVDPTVLRLEMRLSGGLRGAHHIRYRYEMGATGMHGDGAVSLVGAVGTATVAVPPAVDARTLKVVGEVLDEPGRRVATFSSQVLLPARSLPPLGDPVAKQESDGIGWWVWAGIGAVVLGSAAAALTVVAQPDLPDANGTVGRVEL